jgi:hypothetical protein
MDQDLARLWAWQEKLNADEAKLDAMPHGSERDLRLRAWANSQRAFAAAFDAYNKRGKHLNL